MLMPENAQHVDSFLVLQNIFKFITLLSVLVGGLVNGFSAVMLGWF